MAERVGGPQSLADKAISGARAFWYAVSEPALLAAAREVHGWRYADPEARPLISVYVPTYNRAELLLARAVPSVLAQTYRNFEFIILGDCCTDDTAARVAAVGDPRIRFHNLPARGYRYPPTAENHWFAGPVVAANAALRLVRGDWIARIDDDDLWTPDHLEVLLAHAQAHDLEFVSAAYERERDGLREVVDCRGEMPRIGGTQTWLYRSYLSLFRYNIDCWRKAWNRVNDTDIQDRMWKAGVRMGFLDRVVAQILPRPGDTTIGLQAYLRRQDEMQEHFRF